MSVARFKVQAEPERAEEVASAITAVEAPSREIPGVIHLDVPQRTSYRRLSARVDYRICR